MTTPLLIWYVTYSLLLYGILSHGLLYAQVEFVDTSLRHGKHYCQIQLLFCGIGYESQILKFHLQTSRLKLRIHSIFTNKLQPLMYFAGVSVLLFSRRGVGRCAAAMSAYLMFKYHWGFEKTYDFLYSKKPDIEINKGYLAI